jgi:rare lipoprotein A (RlpA)-like double-psi beta-barrel protein
MPAARRRIVLARPVAGFRAIAGITAARPRRRSARQRRLAGSSRPRPRNGRSFVRNGKENPRTGASVVVIINDRGPFTRGRDIDLSQGAARAIGLKDVGRICAEIL